MCSDCRSSTQGVYNTSEDNLNSKPYTDDNGAQSESGSASEEGLPNGQDEKFEQTKSTPAKNTQIGEQGFGS
jgi:hypothetical protein